MIDICGLSMNTCEGMLDLTVKNILKMRKDMKIIFLTVSKKKVQVILPYRYFGYTHMKIGEVYD